VAPTPTPTPTPVRYVDPYYGVGVPCVQGDTPVLTLQDGVITWVASRDVQIGDTLVVPKFTELDENLPDWNLYEWNTSTLTMESYATAKVINKVQSVHQKVAYFNSDVANKFSEFHPILALRDGVYEFFTVASLIPGDTLFLADGESALVPVVIESINWVNGVTDAYNFSVENIDLVVAGRYVTHNK
jgi:hypothetical protein